MQSQKRSRPFDARKNQFGRLRGLQPRSLAVPGPKVDYVAEKIIELYRIREKINGLEIAWEPPAGSLRFFLMRFTPIGGRLVIR
jgi:tryptophanase